MFFTDMEGSTRLLQRLGERYADVLKTCRRLLREAFQQCNGYEVDTQGDAFFVVFERALDAVLAAIIAQRALFATHWPENAEVRVRMGIHTGEPHLVDEGYIGLDVHRTARIMSVAHGGQVLLSQVTRDLIFRDLPEGITLWYLGEHRLKDIAERTRLFQLAVPGLPDHFPPLSTSEAQSPFRPLPVPATSFVGREQEIATILQLLRQPATRLLTLIGPAGVGKTRLALHIAAQVAEQAAGNLAFVPLEHISEAEAVLSTIAQALGIQEASTSPLLQQVQALLNEQPFLLILDNFEQVVAARLAIAQLLSSCPGLKILITSRVLLHLQAEHLCEILPLPLPASGVDDLTELARSTAVALFVQRAQAVAPAFRLTSANASAVREICARLDGLPLAIELAAARLRHVPLATVLSQIVESPAELGGTMPDLSERQRTLRSAIAWSYHLLEPDEQRVFRRLAVFANGMTMEAARHVCSMGEKILEDFAGIMRALVDKSIIQRQGQGEREERFWLLQTLSEYGKEQMMAAGEWEEVRALHAGYYLAWTERIAPLLSGAQQTHWLDQLDQDYENVRTALAWMLERGQELEQAEWALRLCAALPLYWETRGYLKEGLAFLEQALSSKHEVATSLRAYALYMAGFFALMLGENERAEYFLRECQILFRESRDRGGMANILRLQGNLAIVKSSYKVARRLLEEALLIYQEQGETRKVVQAREDLAQVAVIQGDYSRARALTTENLALYRAWGEVYITGYSLYRLARICFLTQDDLAEAQSLAEESLACFRSTGDRRFSANVLNLLGQILLRTERSEAGTKARPLLEESLAMFKAVGDRSGIVETLFALARLETAQGKCGKALDCYRESWKLLQALRDREQVALCLEGAGQVAVALQAPEQAVRLWGTAAAVRAAIVVPLPPVYRAEYLQALAQARGKLGEKQFRACWSQGSQTPWKQVNLSNGIGVLPG